MSSIDTIQKPGPADFLPLTRYLDVLVQKYPKPLTPNQLSKFSKVTLAAVSKMRDRLFPICDVKWLASRRRSLLLKNDPDTFLRLGFTFYIDSRLGQFLESPYAQTFLRKLVLDSHANMAKVLPSYSAFFDQNDALFFVGLGVHVLTDVLDHLPKTTIRDLDSESLLATILSQVIQLGDEVWPALSQQLKEPNTLEGLLAIRDKLWYMAQEIAKLFLPQAFAHILSTLPDEKIQQDYLRVYLYTADFYLEKFLTETITKKIREAAENVKVPWKESYDRLGSIFTTPEIRQQEPMLDLPIRDSQVTSHDTKQVVISKGAGTARGEKEPRIELSSH